MRNFRGTARRAVVIAGVAAVGVTAMPAHAESDFVIGFEHQDGPLPQGIVDDFASCPTIEQMQAAGAVASAWCIKVTAYEGQLQIGKIRASIDDPIHIVVGGGLDADYNTVIVPAAGGGGAPGAVKISGGILGIPALDPILDQSLGLLSLTATPELGAIGATPGRVPSYLSTITLPLSIKLNNALFGPNCRIGTPAEPITITLSTEEDGGQRPVEGREQRWTGYGTGGVVGDFGPSVVDASMVGTIGYGQGVGALEVDDDFAVPSATNCDPLPRALHTGLDPITRQVDNLLGRLGLPKVVNRMIGNTGGLFNPLIDSVAGLPSPAGRNSMSLKVDAQYVTYQGVMAVQGAADQLYRLTGAHANFGTVTLGDTVEHTMTFTNTSDEPRDLPGGVFGSGPGVYASTGDEPFGDPSFVFTDTCQDGPVAPGGTCSYVYEWTPSRTADILSGMIMSPFGVEIGTFEAEVVNP